MRLHDALVIDETSALLLEACEPGTPLSQLAPAPEQDAVIPGLLHRLWIEPPAGHGFRALQSMCDAWAGVRAEARDLRRPRGPARSGSYAGRHRVLRRLPATSERSVLLCTDLHPENVLAAGREPWLMIDPKPYVGDPTYHPVQHMLNFPTRLGAGASGFVKRMTDLLGLNADRLRQWLFARCVQESIDQPHLGAVAISLAP